jgi:beta-lactamase class A
MKFCVLLLAFAFAACTANTAIPLEYPTPEPPPSATPLPKLELKRDAELEKQFAKIAKDAKGKVGVAAVVLETGEAALLNADDHYPMQSVYKLPISMAVMEQARLGKLDLDEEIGVTKEDMVRPGQASPLRDKNPNGGEFTIRELIRFALVESDGTASDVLMRLAGGPKAVQDYLTQIGIRDMKVVNTEKEFALDWQTQYENWTTPIAAVELIRLVHTGRNASVNERAPTQLNGTPSNGRVSARNVNSPSKIGSDEETDLIVQFMISAVTGPKRLKGLLPSGTRVAHKTGTSGSRAGVTAATNDIGIIYLRDGRHLAIAVFVADSPANDKTREALIARTAKTAWDSWNR